MISSSFRARFLEGRAALITGGGTGICRGIALAYATYGCDVAIVSRDPAHLEPTVSDLRGLGVQALSAAVDVRDAVGVAGVVEETVARLGRLDVLVNGAAGNFLCLAEDLSPNGFGAVVDIDLKGTFHVSRAAFPHLKATRGTIVNISATLHHGATVAQLHVSAAKAGLDALTRNLAVEWGGYGIRVNGLAPGPIADTEGVKRLLPGDARTRVERRTPLGRMGAIDDIAAAALFLSSPAAAFINGHTLVVDGGLSLVNNQLAARGSTPEGGHA